MSRSMRPHPLTAVGVVIWAVVAWLYWTMPPVHAGWRYTGVLDARPWLEQRAYWEAVTWRRALIARRFRGSPEHLDAYQTHMDSAYNPTYLLLGPNDDPYKTSTRQ